MFFRLSNRKGISLLELLLIVVILGILLALTIPRFTQETTRAKQTEAKIILKQVVTMNHAYCQEYGYYSLSLKEIGVTVPENSYYSYKIELTEFGFKATATGDIDDDPILDVWTIDQTGELINLTSDVWK